MSKLSYKLLARGRFVLLLLVATMLSASAAAAGQSLPLKGTYGDESGCQFAKDSASLSTDSRAFVSKLGIQRHEVSCSFIEVTSVKDQLSRSGITGAWHVKTICEAEGDAYPEDVVIVETVDADGGRSLELRYSSDTSETLQHCK